MPTNEDESLTNELMLLSIHLDQVDKSLKQTSSELSQMSQRLAPEIKKEVRASAQSSYQELEERSKAIVAQTNTSSQKLINATNYVDQKLKQHYLLGIGSALTIGALLVIIPALYAYFKTQELSTLRQEVETLQHNKDVLRAISQYHFNMCGGKLCVKLDRNDPIWKNSQDYIVIK